MVGTYMNYAGNHLLEWIHREYKVKPFYHGYRVVGVQLLANGDVITTALRQVQVPGAKRPQVVHQQVVFHSKGVILSNGGEQEIHPLFFRQWFPFVAPEKVVKSDWFLRRSGYRQTMQKIVKGRLQNIVIIGGSASGFSAAWMILNGPACVQNAGEEGYLQSGAPAARKVIPNCKDCCSCPKSKTR